MFVGETPSKALKRFCGMLKLNEAQCTQAKLAYYELCQKNNIRDVILETELSGSRGGDGGSDGAGDSSSGNEGNIEEATAGSEAPPFNFQREDHSRSSKQSSHKEEAYSPLIQWILDVCEEYWNLIALLIVVLYIATEQMP
jgi:hypothetical protein